MIDTVLRILFENYITYMFNLFQRVVWMNNFIVIICIIRQKLTVDIHQCPLTCPEVSLTPDSP